MINLRKLLVGSRQTGTEPNHSDLDEWPRAPSAWLVPRLVWIGCLLGGVGLTIGILSNSADGFWILVVPGLFLSGGALLLAGAVVIEGSRDHELERSCFGGPILDFVKNLDRFDGQPGGESRASDPRFCQPRCKMSNRRAAVAATLAVNEAVTACGVLRTDRPEVWIRAIVTNLSWAAAACGAAIPAMFDEHFESGKADSEQFRSDRAREERQCLLPPWVFVVVLDKTVLVHKWTSLAGAGELVAVWQQGAFGAQRVDHVEAFGVEIVSSMSGRASMYAGRGGLSRRRCQSVIDAVVELGNR